MTSAAIVALRERKLAFARSRGADVDERGERRGEGGGAGFKAAVGDASIEVGV